MQPRLSVRSLSSVADCTGCGCCLLELKLADLLSEMLLVQKTGTSAGSFGLECIQVRPALFQSCPHSTQTQEPMTHLESSWSLLLLQQTPDLHNQSTLSSVVAH